MTKVDDARQIRSRSLLHDAVLAAGAAAPISSVTATEVANLAGVGRATFYRHAASPSALLESALSRELDELRTEAFRQDLSDPLQRRRLFEITLMKVVEHVVARESIYAPALLSDAAPGVAKMLIDHLHESILQAERLVGIGAWNGDVLPPDMDVELFAEAAASGFAHLFVGVLTSWLRRESHRDPQEFLSVFTVLAPRWWLRSDAGAASFEDETR